MGTNLERGNDMVGLTFGGKFYPKHNRPGDCPLVIFSEPKIKMTILRDVSESFHPCWEGCEVKKCRYAQ